MEYLLISGFAVEVQHHNPIRNLTIRDLKILGAGDGTTDQLGLNVRYFDGVRLFNINVDGCPTGGIDCWVGMNFTAEDCPRR